jgi:uncharacterized protein
LLGFFRFYSSFHQILINFSPGGGSGFIGTALKGLLTRNGYDVVTVSRMPGPNRISWVRNQQKILFPCAYCFTLHLTNFPQIDLPKVGIPQNCKAVINLAGQNILDPRHRWTAGFKQNVYSSRINTTKWLADAINAAPVKPDVFITVSGVGNF